MASVVAGGLSGSMAMAQVTKPSPIFGFVRATLHGSGTHGGVTLLGPTFVEAVAAEFVLQAGAPRPFELTAVGTGVMPGFGSTSGTLWGTSVFKTHPEASSHYVEVRLSTNLAAVGMTSEIVSHTSSTLMIADDWSGLLRGGETLVIRPHRTLAGLFGTANQAGLTAGDATTADVISVLSEGSTAAFTSYYYRSGSPLGGTGWRSSANPFTDQASLPLRTGQGLLIKRRQAEALKIVLQGFVKPGIWRRTVPQGFSLIDPLAPLTDQRASQPVAGPAFTLGGTSGAGAIPSGLASTLRPGSPQTADLVSLAGTVASFYVAAPNGLSSGGWRLTSNPFVDQQNTVIPAASAMLIQNRGTAKQWSRPQPFVVSTP